MVRQFVGRVQHQPRQQAEMRGLCDARGCRAAVRLPRLPPTMSLAMLRPWPTMSRVSCPRRQQRLKTKLEQSRTVQLSLPLVLVLPWGVSALGACMDSHVATEGGIGDGTDGTCFAAIHAQPSCTSTTWRRCRA